MRSMVDLPGPLAVETEHADLRAVIEAERDVAEDSFESRK
jgi:hypothetical protein